MTQDLIILLHELRASKTRGAASMGCSSFRPADVLFCEKQGWIKQHGFGPTAFYITEPGLAALAKTKYKPPKPPEESNDVRQKQDREAITQRWVRSASGKWVPISDNSR